MPSIGLFARTSLPALRKVLDLAALRQRVYATNVANAETPGYNRRDVKFADAMKNAAGAIAPATTDPMHMGGTARTEPSFEIVEDETENGAAAGVDLETEMVSLAENQLRFNLAARLAAMRVAGLRASIRGRS